MKGMADNISIKFSEFDVSTRLFRGRIYDKIYRSKKHSGIILFIHLIIAKCFFLTFLCTFIAIHLFKYFNATTLTIDVTAGLIAVFFEEQSRWMYSVYSENIVKSQIQFAIMGILLESFGYWNYKNPLPIHIYLAVRAGSVIVHSINSLLCVYSFRLNKLMRIIVFIIAIFLHFYMNKYGTELLFSALEPEFVKSL